MAAQPSADWVYQGDRTLRIAGLSDGQRGYAITLRRQLADRLAREASRRALGDTSRAGSEWTRIAAACRRESRRMDRALVRLPKAVLP